MDLLPTLIQVSQKILDMFFFVNEGKISTEHSETHMDP